MWVTLTDDSEVATVLVNPEAVNFRVASGLVGKSADDPQKRYLPAKETEP